MSKIVKDQAIILRNTDFQNTSIITTALTKNSGKHSFIIKGAKRKNSKLPVGEIQPLNVVEITFYAKETRSIDIVKEIQLKHFGIPENFNFRERMYAFTTIEILLQILKEGLVYKGLYEFILQYVQKLPQEKSNYEFHLWFWFNILRFIGFLPSSETHLSSPYLDIATGKFINSAKSSARDKILYEIYRNNFPEGYTSADKLDAGIKLWDYYKKYIPYFRTPNSFNFI